MTIEHFLNEPNRTKFENREMAEILVNSITRGLLGIQNAQSAAVFQDMQLKFGRQVLFYTYSVFLKKIPKNIRKQKNNFFKVCFS